MSWLRPNRAGQAANGAEPLDTTITYLRMAAEALGANLFYTRLAGHGRSDDAMAEPVVQDWMDDVAEAIAIGERLGETVVLIGTSTGGTLAAIAALHPDLRDRIDGIVFVSPNFKVKAGGSEILTM